MPTLLTDSPAEVAKRKVMARWWPMRNHPIQRELWMSTKRFIGCAAGRRSGKTELAKRKLILSLPILKPWPDPRYFYSAPTEGQAKKLAWKDLISMIPPGWIAGEPHGTDLIIETKFGSSLHIIGLDKPQRAEGLPWDGGVVDESCDVKPDAINVSIGPALADRFGWLMRIGVPKRTGIGAVAFKEFCERCASGDDPDEQSYTWPSSDIQPPKVLRYYQEHMDPKDYAEQWDASWQKAGGKVFYAYEEAYNKRACDFDPGAPIVIGCDFNVDPMAWVIGHKRDYGIDWFDEIFERNTNTPAVLDILWEKYGSKTHGTMSFYGDATGRGRHTSASLSDYQHIVGDKRFKAKGATVHFPAVNPSVADRFSACNALFRNAAGNRRCFVDPRCVHLLIDIENRGYKPHTTEPDDKGDVGHSTDGMGYPIYMLYPSSEEQKGKTEIKIRKREPGGNGRPSALPRVRRRHARAR